MKRALIGVTIVFISICLYSIMESEEVSAAAIISDVSTAVSTLLNVTTQANFTHLQTDHPNLAAYYPFDFSGNSSATFDYGPLKNTGACGSLDCPPFNASGAIGNASSFTPDTGVIQQWNTTASTTTYARNFTIAGWITYSDCALFNPIVGGSSSTGGAVILVIRGQGVCRLDFYAGGDTTSGTDIFPDQWVFFAVTQETTVINFYVNGTINDNVTANLGLGATQTAYIDFIGYDPFNEDLTGSLDNIMLFNNTLNAEEINALYNNQSTIFFSQGEQIFENTNTTSLTDNRVNITINSTTLFDSSINITVGDVSGDSYAYGAEFAFTVNEAQDIPMTTPENISLKFIFYAGNETANPFYSPTLENDILIDSHTAADTDPPLYFNLSSNPASRGNFSATQFYEFNVTWTDDTQVDNVFIVFNGVNYSAANGEVYNISTEYTFNRTGLAASTYTYTWFANDTTNYENQTSQQSYTVVTPSSVSSQAEEEQKKTTGRLSRGNTGGKERISKGDEKETKKSLKEKPQEIAPALTIPLAKGARQAQEKLVSLIEKYKLQKYTTPLIIGITGLVTLMMVVDLLKYQKRRRLG